MADFNQAYAYLIGFEGTKPNVNKKTGEVSRFGLTLKTLSKLMPAAGWTADMVIELTADRARQITQSYFWDPRPYTEIVDQSVANKYFDMAFNMGEPSADLLVHRILGIDTHGTVFGALTLKQINARDPVLLLSVLRDVSKSYYWEVARDHPEHAGDLAGWLTRAAA